jgi:hypothetical protein
MQHACVKKLRMASTGNEPCSLLGRLILVGVDHGDPEGFRRTRELLSRLKPDLVLIELSPFGRSLRVRLQRSLLKTLAANVSRACCELRLWSRDAQRHPEIVRIRRQITLPFEYRATRRYCGSHDSRMLLCDSSDFSRHWVASWPGMISLANVRSLLSAPGIARCHESLSGYGMAARALAAESADEWLWNRVLEKRWDSWWDRREHHLAGTVWAALHALRPVNPVYLGGWLHLLQGQGRPTLRGLLNIPRHRCMLLPEAVVRQSFPRALRAMQSR